jgi:hypothetical protein
MLRSAYHFLCIALLGCLAGYLLRVYLVQPAEIGAMCSLESPPLWCLARDYLIQGMIVSAWGQLAIVFIVLSVLLKLTAARLVLIPGLFLAGVSLFLFGPLLGALGCVAGLVRGITLTND